VWDTWYQEDATDTHVFYLQVRRPESTHTDDYEGTVGHAVSSDLINWKELPTALYKGETGSYDDGSIATGCTIKHDGKWYLYYSSNHRENGRTLSGMCLATSFDGITWEKYADNPVITPDPRWYHSKDSVPPSHYYHCYPDVDCRDLAIVKDPDGDGWLGYVVVRLKDGNMNETCCMALVESDDLVHWEMKEPCCAPNRFVCFEVPEVFELDGKWYMLALTGDAYGQRRRWTDPYIGQGTLVFEADNPRGPFIEVKDNLLLASIDNQGFSVRTTLKNDERLMFYTRAEWLDGRQKPGRLSWPVKLVHGDGGGLNPVYWQGIDKVFGEAKLIDSMSQTCKNGWIIHKIEDIPDCNRTLMVNAVIDVADTRGAGIVLSGSKLGFSNPGILALLDPEFGEVAILRLTGFVPVQRRQWDIKPGNKYSVRLITVEEMLELYIDDVLVLNTFAEDVPTNSTGFYIQEGTATIEKITVQTAK
jgi:beta-fructofuranosidase